MKRNRFLLLIFALVAFGPTAWAQVTTINSTADWVTFCNAVNNGTTYSGQTVTLTADIGTTNSPVTTMSGTDNNRFKGTFDGGGNTITFSVEVTDQYAAPFRYIEGAIIKNLKVTGTVTTHGNATQNKGKFAGGVVAHAKGTGNTITNCINSTIIDASGATGGSSNGGILGQLGGSNGSVTISGCVFNGKMLGTNVDHWCGIIGYYGSNGSRVTIEDCFFAPQEINVQASNNNFTICRTVDPQPTVSNCYYNEEGAKMPTKRGKQARTITSANNNVALAFAGDATEYSVSGITTNGIGIKYNNVLYAGNSDNVSLSLTAPLGYEITVATYTYEGGSETKTIYPNNGVYSFTMPNANVIINAETDYRVNYWEGAGTLADPFRITSTDDFDMLSTLVRGLPDGHPFYHGADLIFYGCYFKLMNDLDYSDKTFTPVGHYNSSSDYRGFGGNFDGQGHVIQGINYATTGSAGIFGFASGNISNLALVSSTLTGGNRTGGIVGYYNGGNGKTISNCHVASNVNINTSILNVQWHGGIVGRKAGGTVSYCTSAAYIQALCSTGEDYLGGIAGANVNGTIDYCLFTNNSASTVSSDNKGPIAGSNHGTLTNCYWTNPSFGTGSGDVALAPSTNYDNSGFINTITVIQNKMTVASYSPAFKALAPIGLTISAWNNNDNPVGGWYFIASPVVGDIAPDAVMNLLGTQIPNSSLYNFDLYRFNQSPDMINGEYKEWENYHQHNETEEPFLLENGKGYLYARSEETTLTFTGTFNTSTEPVDVTLTYETTNPKAIMHGWNLVGNPFPVTAYVNRPFYKMNDAGTGIVPVVNDFNSYTPTTIPTCTGIMVQTTADEVTQGTNKVTFSTTVPTQQATNNGNLQIALSQSNTRGNALLDNAIVSFNEGSKLGKFYFGEQNANIYIPQNAEEYAIAYSNKQGEMPLNFKATKDGEYSLNVNPENVEMSYLHLIDNMTGADIDLLAANGGDAMNRVSTYTFTAKTTDYESRFKLVFSANTEDGPSTGSGTFAFFSDGNWIIANEGEATLQVVDLMGRILSSETVNGSVSKAINTVPGVYMIRLINGENVKVQKVVIE